MSVIIDQNQCTGCGNCINYCPLNLLRLSEHSETNSRGVRYIKLSNPDKCTECGRCEWMCTAAALHRVPVKNGYPLLDKEHIPPHSGCYLGSLAKALAEAVHELNIEDKAVLFKKKAADVNLLVESYDYTDDSFYEDGLKYKREHPEKVVILICNSSKVHSTAANEERYRKLSDENVTIINSLNWFESNPEITVLEKGGSRILEEIAPYSRASFLARSCLRSPRELLNFKNNLKHGLVNQMEGKGFSIIEVTFPCFYRLAGRPQTLMPYEKIHLINQWFDKEVKPLYPEKIFKEDEK